MPDPQTIVSQFLSELERLNPDAVTIRPEQARKASRQLPADAFVPIADRVLQIVHQFTRSPLKRNQRDLLKEYFSALAKTTKRLSAVSESASDAERAGDKDLIRRLLPVRRESLVQWAQVVAQSDIPAEMHRAVDASANRNEAVITPVESALLVLFAVDVDVATAWSIEQIENNPDFSDADVLRDLIAAWNSQPDLPLCAGSTILGIVADERMEQIWPGTALQANRAVRFVALKALAESTSSGSSEWGQLEQIIRRGPGAVSESSLQRWLDAAVERFGRHVGSFILGAARIDNPDTSEELRRMVRRQLYTDVRAVNNLHPAIMVGADLLLKQADGAHALALAFLGIDRTHLRKWRKSLEDKAAVVVRTLFLEDLKNRRDSAETVRRLCLGDDLLFISLYSKLDLITKQFGSLRDREDTVAVLAANYASFREVDLLKDKILAHYRRLAKLLHEDSLRRLLPPDVGAADLSPLLPHLSLALARAAESRRYLEGRRALETSLDDMCAAELTYEQEIRSARATLLRSLLVREQQG